MQPGFALAGRYVLERLLGQGAVGEVWQATDRELDRAVAVKVIRERITDPKLAAGLLDEARIAGRLRHPGITVVHDAGEHDGQPFIVMELLHGRDLDAVLEDWPGGMPANEAISLGIQAADALAAAHAGGVVHRDLKPANLFVQEDGQVKICDFGIAVVSGAASPTSASYVVGTPAYMAPEQCDGQEAGEPGDVYSLGCVLYALLTGRPPFASGPPLAIMAQHRTAVPAGPQTLRPAIPTDLDRLVTGLLAKHPAARPGGAAQVAAALRALQGQADAATPTVTPVRPAREPGGGRRPSGSAGQAAAPRAVAGPPTGPAAVSSRQLLATAGDDRTVRLWDPVTGQQAAALRGHERGINAMCPVTADGRSLLATASSDGTARLWDLATGQQGAVLAGHERKINAVCPVTADGRPLLATASSDGTARLWDPATGLQAAVLSGHQGRVHSVCAVTADGRPLLATASSDRTTRLWDPATARQTAVLEGRVRTVCAVTVGGRPMLATGRSDGTVRLWDPVTGQQTAIESPREFWSVAKICPVTIGGRPLLAFLPKYGSVILWDPASGLQATEMWGDIKFGEVTPSPIGSVTVGGRALLAAGNGGTVRLWDPATGQQALALHGHGYGVNAVCLVTVSFPEPLPTIGDDRAGVSANLDRLGAERLAEDPVGRPDDASQLLATASSDHTARLWDPATGQQVTMLRGHKSTINAICPVTASGRQLLATAGRDHTARLWDPATGQQAAMLRERSKTSGMCSVTAGGRQLLAIVGGDRTARLWDPVTGLEVTTLQGHKGTINEVCPVIADGRQLLATAGRDRTARLWDPITGQQAAVLRGHQGRVSTICAVTVGGRPLLATGGSDGTVRLWDPATGQQAAVMQAHPGRARRRSAVTGICAITVDERPILAASSLSGTVHLWDPATGQQAAVMQLDPGSTATAHDPVTKICSVAVGGRPLLAAGSLSGTVHLWDLATGQHTATLQGHKKKINAMCPVTISSARLLATASDDHAARPSDSPPGS